MKTSPLATTGLLRSSALFGALKAHTGVAHRNYPTARGSVALNESIPDQLQ